ncbi:transcriptional regulator [Lysinibacillus fusiformis]|uniref:transcriptional regulator n=1 Tax=Lysinibacillus fusiformis TaxID=28031 RepID=UPI001EF53A25|nr:transcriptional regulator [Lysinibacillus fusiformis]MCG7437668.1 transcriptional regulator [Lysinibacillus fusiformis]
MKNKILSIILAVFVLLTSGCINNNNFKISNHEKKVIDPNISILNEDKVVTNLKLQGDLKNIYYADGNKILILADKLYLYDLGAREVIAEAPKLLFNRENYWVIENGYAVVGETLISRNDKVRAVKGVRNYNCIFYDHNLNKVAEFDFNKLVGDNAIGLDMENISFSSDGTKVLYALTDGLYQYDFVKNKKSTIVNLKSNDYSERFGIVAFEQIDFTNYDKNIAFKAQSFDIPVLTDSSSFDSCGILNTNGSLLWNRGVFDDYKCKKITAYNDHILLAEDITIASGRLFVFEYPSDKMISHILLEKLESGSVSGSDFGKYFATSIPNNDSWIIRIYNTKTGKLESEQQVSSGGKEYMAQDPIIKIIDDTKTCIMLFGSKRDDILTKMVVSQF